MKNTYKAILVVALIGLSTACDDKLDLKSPQDADEGLVLSTDANVKSVLTGAYDILSRSSLFGGNVLRNSELLAANDEIVFSGTYTEPAEMASKSIITVNTNVADFWVDSYALINTVNNVLSAIAIVKEEDRSQVEGEALFLRGLVYFELVKYFAKPFSDGNAATNDGVPVIFDPSRASENAEVSRNTVKEVYDQVLNDLAKAVSLLESNPSKKTRATKEAALAILSRVYLQMGNYEGARDAANEVITSANYELLNNYEDNFNGAASAEDILAIPVSVTDGVNTMQLYYAPTAEGGRGDIEIEQKHLALYQEDDNRLALFYEDESTGDIRTGKWVDQYGYVKVIRLAEMYLTRAEGNFVLGEAVGGTPLSDYNEVHQRAGLDALTEVDIELIIKERHLELAQEGHHLHDIKRLKQSIVEGNTTYAYDDDMLVFPIPQRERNVNRNLTQNDGYGNN